MSDFIEVTNVDAYDFKVVLPTTTKEWQRDMDIAYQQGRADATKELPTSLYCDGFNDGYPKGRTDMIDEIKQNFHNVYSDSLYCLENMAEDCKEHGCNCDDCLYVMFNKVLEQLKEKNK